MNVFGADLAQGIPDKGTPLWTLVATDESGAVQEIRHPSSLPGLVAEIAALTGEDPFLLGVNIPVVVPARAARSRPFEGLLRKKFGFRISDLEHSSNPFSGGWWTVIPNSEFRIPNSRR